MRSPTAAVIRSALPAGVLALAALLLADPGFAQTSGQQTGRPQPEPAPKAAAPKGGQQAPVAPKGTAAPKGTGPTAPVTAQALKKKSPRIDRGFVGLSAGAVLAAPKHTSSTTFIVHAEDAVLEARSSVEVGPVFSLRAGMKAGKRLGIGAGVNLAAASQKASVAASLPHPFLFDRDRQVDGTASGLRRLETMVSIEGTWWLLARPRRQVSVFAGPAYFDVRQDMVSSIRFSEVYPYDSATFVGTESTRVGARAIGGTAGADAAWMVTRRLGIGGEVRYSYGSARLDSGGQSGRITLGGLQLGVCARVLF